MTRQAPRVNPTPAFEGRPGNVSDIAALPGITRLDVEAMARSRDGSWSSVANPIKQMQDGPMDHCTLWAMRGDEQSISVGTFTEVAHALACAQQVSALTGWPVAGGVFDLVVRHVTGQGYIAHPAHFGSGGANPAFTDDPAKAMLWSRGSAKDEALRLAKNYATADAESAESGQWLRLVDLPATTPPSMRDRVTAAAIRAMGVAAPPANSPAHAALVKYLGWAVEASQKEADSYLAPATRECLVQALQRIELERNEDPRAAAGALDYGFMGLADRTDDQVLERAVEERLSLDSIIGQLDEEAAAALIMDLTGSKAIALYQSIGAAGGDLEASPLVADLTEVAAATAVELRGGQGAGAAPVARG